MTATLVIPLCRYLSIYSLRMTWPLVMITVPLYYGTPQPCLSVRTCPTQPSTITDSNWWSGIWLAYRASSKGWTLYWKCFDQPEWHCCVWVCLRFDLVYISNICLDKLLSRQLNLRTLEVTELWIHVLALLFICFSTWLLPTIWLQQH